MRLLSLLALLMLPFSIASAQEAAVKTEPFESTRIEADNEAGVIRFIVKGKVAAILMEDGLHIRESVAYGGSLTDYGAASFDKTLEEVTPRKDSADAQ